MGKIIKLKWLSYSAFKEGYLLINSIRITQEKIKKSLDFPLSKPILLVKNWLGTAFDKLGQYGGSKKIY